MIKSNISKIFWRSTAVIIGMLFVLSVFYRFAFGIGAVSNLSDAFPWGIWIGFDLLVGVGLAAGGFVIASIVHVFGLEEYKPVARPAILTAFLGYVLVVLALLVDLGIPWRIWHPLVHWNHHSVMFEVGWCVTIYTTVLAAEFSPMLFERLGWKVPLKIIRFFYIPLVIMGFLLSTMHQSSLGSLFLIVPGKMHPLWYSSMLPVLFFISAVSVGLSMTIMESYLSNRAFKKELEPEILQGLAKVAVVVLGVYGMLRLMDLLNNGGIAQAFLWTRESALFHFEIIIGIVLPIILYSMKRIRQDSQGLFFTSLMAITGFILNRLNVGITSMTASSGVSYFPTWMEVMISLGLVVLGFIAFGMAVRYLKVFPTSQLNGPFTIRKPSVVWGGRLVATTWVIIVMMAGFYFLVPTTEIEANSTPAEVEEVLDIDFELVNIPDDLEFTSAEDSPGIVTFSHESHLYSVDKISCKRCHDNSWPILADGVIATESYSYETIHEGKHCASCHNDEVAFDINGDCDNCHY